jgi:predicted GH43/DUF377 family glycosyl hydrolase
MRKKIFIPSLIGCFILIRLFYFLSYPKILRTLPKADKIGIVKEIKEIKIQNLNNPINACIEEYKDNNYILTFKINENDLTYIAISILDENLNEIKEYKKIDVQTKSAQDARIFKFNDDYYLIYNDKLPIKHLCRAMHLAKFNDQTFRIEYKTILDQHIKTIEKNWVPFIFQNKIFLAYSLMPHKIMEIKDPSKNNLKHWLFTDNPCYTRFFWKWGTPRGGSPAKLVDDEYLAFFHSSFGKNKKKKFYVMGAYTYQAYPPYKVTKVSKFPIIFGNNKKTRIYFPTGFIIKKENNKDMIYLSYGENDKTSKIAIIDKAKLFENMRKVY